MKNSFRTIIISLIVLFFIYSFNNAKTGDFEKVMDKRGFAIIELFTSEGCSSCPPADEAVAELQNSYPDKNVLVLAYHVDYWDQQGWKDPFSAADFTARQKYYAGIFKLNSIYTPQVVVNATTEFVGSEKNKLIRETGIALQETSKETIQLNAKETGAGKIDIRDSTNEKITEDEALIILLVQKSATNKIMRGENKGRILHHINIVQKIIYLPASLSGKTTSLLLPAGQKKESFFIASLIQNRATGKFSAMMVCPIN
jgi:hypothetical protein